jgi:endoglucanase
MMNLMSLTKRPKARSARIRGVRGVALATACGALFVGVSPGCSSTGASKGKSETVVLGKGRKQGTAAPAMPGVNVPAIKVDTVGYPTGWRKVAIWNVEPKDAVVKDASGKVVLRIPASAIVSKGKDEASQDPVWQVDLSELKTPGTYKLASAGAESDSFQVGEKIYDEALVAGLKSFYFQRTRTALVEPYAVWKGDKYLRPGVSHVGPNVGWDLNDFPDKKTRWKVEGGWHDAGNYDMYIPSTGPTAQALLFAYEWSPDAFDDKSDNIPESGNGIPDVLDEAKWGIVWVLSVQEPGGAFRMREAVTDTSPELPADQDDTTRWISGVSTAASWKAVALLSQAARIYKPFDPKFAARCEEAARKGWAWLEKNPKRVKAENKGGTEQPLWDDEPDGSDVGARFEGAVEYWRTFRDQGALAKAKALFDDAQTSPEEIIKGAWANISRWGLTTLALDEGTPKAIRTEAQKRLVAGADMMRKQSEEKDGYRCASTVEEYYWASNSNLMEKTHILAVAARLTHDERYLQAARDQWHWVLGRNPNGFSMVTRVGKGPTALYHMEWGHKPVPPPGYLVGGPNAMEASFLAPGAPAKAILWDNPRKLRSGTPAHTLWHWQQQDLWDGGFEAEEEWDIGWWTVIEPDIYYSANFVLAAVAVR